MTTRLPSPSRLTWASSQASTRAAWAVGLLGAQIGVKGGFGATGGVQFFPNIDDFDEFLGGGLDVENMSRIVDPSLYRNRSQ